MTQAPFDPNDRNNSVDRSLEATLAREEAATNAALEAEAQQQLNNNSSKRIMQRQDQVQNHNLEQLLRTKQSIKLLLQM